MEQKIPSLQINKRFRVEIITEHNFEQAVECFSEGYSKSNPFFIAIGLDDPKLIKEFIILNLKVSPKKQNFYSLAIIDTECDNKIVGVSVAKDFTSTTQFPKIDSPGMRFKQYLDYKVFAPLSPEYNVEGISFYGFTSILPEYQGKGVYTDYIKFAFQYARMIGFKCMIDVYYNVATGYVVKKFPNLTIISDINIQEEYMDGVQVFKGNDKLCAVSFKLDINDKFFEALSSYYTEERVQTYKQFFEDIKTFDSQR